MRLRADLRAADFTTDAIEALIGDAAAAALHREQPLPAIRGSLDGSVLATLVRFFALGLPVARVDLDLALPVCGADGLRELGIVMGEDHVLRAACDLRPYGDESHSWWLASDLSQVVTRSILPLDHVLGIGGASATLAGWTPRRPSARALDVGTGCGVQALHLLTHCDAVVATDISQRALDYARFNADLNDCEIDLRKGSLLDPVRGEMFDLVVSNPPFVITPRTSVMPQYEYRDGGMTGDRLVRALIEQLPSVLAPGGVAQLLANWEIPRGHDWREVLTGWVTKTGLDAWVVQRDVQDPAQYAELWASDGGHGRFEGDHHSYDEMYAAWLDDFADRDVDRIGFGVITLQRPATPRTPFLDLTDVPGLVGTAMGSVIDAGLRARTAIAEVGDTYLLQGYWRAAADVTEERHSTPGAEDPSVILLRQGGGLRQAVRMDTALAAFVSVCDGELVAAAAIDAIAQLLEEDATELRTRLLPQIGALVADGLLII
ncbi:MAG: methyltransferase [Allobranchiibius sp.]